MGKRYIDADALYMDIIHRFDYCDDFLEMIESAPTADVRENVRGEWILDDNPHDGDCRCSACGIAIDQMHERNHGLLNALTNGKWWSFYNYCPNCGADMRERKNNENMG